MNRTPRRFRLADLALLLAALLGAGWLVQTFSRPSIRMDGVGYYAPLASLLMDHDLDLRNEIHEADSYMRSAYFVTADGRVVDPYAVGAAVLWSPVLLVTRALDPNRYAGSGSETWRYASPGFLPRYVRAVAIATGLEALLGCALLYAALRRRTGKLASITGMVGAALGTPLVYYALAEPSYAHTASFLASAALLAATLASRRFPLAGLGALWGLVTLVRWQDAVLGVLLVPRLSQEVEAARREGWGRLARSLLLVALPAVLVLLPQILFWQRVYGQALVLTVGGGFMHWSRPQIVPFLLSTWHGAWVWSPLFLAGFIGLAYLPERGLRLALCAAVALEIYTCAAAGDWWGSASFGARRLVATAPFAGLGLALLVQRARHPATRRPRPARTVVALAAVAVCVLWNLRLAQYNMAGLMPMNPGNYREYVRQYPPGDPRRKPYPLWGYARLGSELLDVERRMWKRSEAPR